MIVVSLRSLNLRGKVDDMYEAGFALPEPAGFLKLFFMLRLNRNRRTDGRNMNE
jgi:hypothetical protein